MPENIDLVPCLEAELEEARATNRRLNRKLSQMGRKHGGSPYLKQLWDVIDTCRKQVIYAESRVVILELKLKRTNAELTKLQGGGNEQRT